MSERRYDPTHGEWVTFATDRQDRTYKRAATACPLCPTRPGQTWAAHEPTEIPREHFEIAVFDNRFPSLSPHPPEPGVLGTDLVPVEPAYGHCEVVKYLAGSETFGGAFLTDVAPEVAAERLRAACADATVPA